MGKFSPRQIEILESAGKLLTEYGNSGFTIKKLAKEMNFAESAVYRHFSGKEEIITALLHYLAEDMEARCIAIYASAHSATDKLKKIFADQIDFFVENPFFVGAIFPDGLMHESRKINKAILHLMDVRKKHLLRIVQTCQQEKHFRNDLTTDDLVHILMGSFRLLVLKWRFSNFGFPLQEKGKQLIDNIFRLYAP